MIVESNKIYIGYGIILADVIDEDFYIKHHASFYESCGLRGQYNRECVQYYRSAEYEEVSYDVLTIMIADINFAWSQFLKHKGIDNGNFYNLEFSAFYSGFSGRDDVDYCPEGNCILVFGCELKKNLFETKVTKESTSIKFGLEFPANIRELLAEFYSHINTQQSSYEEIETFPVEPDFSPVAGNLSYYSRKIIFDTFGSCVAGSW